MHQETYILLGSRVNFVWSAVTTLQTNWTGTISIYFSGTVYVNDYAAFRLEIIRWSEGDYFTE